MRNIYLIGPRACGKTTIGKQLAEALKRRFVDTDALFLQKHGEIAPFVESNGWEAFRDGERAVLEDVSNAEDLVVGCGGGIVLRPENREILKKGFTVYLKTLPEDLAERLACDPNESQRPSLTGKGLADEVRDVLAEREPLYSECATAVISASTPEATLALILTALEG